MKNNFIILLVTVLFSQYSQMAYPQEGNYDDVPQEMLVVGRQPGPPMWKVKNGENILWIFPSLSLLPKNMVWEVDKVAVVIEESQEFINMRGGVARMDPIKNPLTMMRVVRMMKRNKLNPNNEQLEEVLPENLYGRYLALKEKYFPRNRGIEKLRPRYAGEEMVNIIYKKSDLVSNQDVLKTIQRLVNKNNLIKTTDVFVELTIGGSVSETIESEEDAIAKRSGTLEIDCFRSQLDLMENDLSEAKSRANAWARGFVDEFKIAYFLNDMNDACGSMQRQEMSQQESIEDLSMQLKSQWMGAAVSALENNQSTFAVLSMRELLSDGGFIDLLQEKGYEIDAPFLR